MSDVDLTNPIVVIFSFFGILFAGIMFMFKIVTFGVMGGLFGAILGIVGLGAVWSKNFFSK